MFERTVTAATAAGALLLGAAWASAAEPEISDPTLAPLVATSGETVVVDAKWQLQATRVSAGSRSAVIDDRIVTVGSRIDGAEVVSIEAGRVNLRRGTRITSIELELPAVKQPSTSGERR